MAIELLLHEHILCKFGERGECGTLEVINHLILTGELQITCLAFFYACDLSKTQLTNMALLDRNLFQIYRNRGIIFIF